jgi:Cu-Zn family superoxide dismutase
MGPDHGAAARVSTAPEPTDPAVTLDRNDGRVVAMTTLAELDGNKSDDSAEIGTVWFVQADDTVTMSGTFRELPPGEHGILITDSGRCEAKSPHFNPSDSKHGPPSSATRHAGDLGNVVVGEDGSAMFELQTDSFTVADGHSSVAGKTLVITARRDTGKTRGAGNTGPAIACGQINLSTHSPPTTMSSMSTL